MKPSMQPPGTGDGPMAEINITPFTDVLLVLLIIFMLLAAIGIPPGFQKSLAKPPTGPRLVDDRQAILVEVQSAGRFLVDRQPATEPTLDAAMARAIAVHRSDPRRFSTHIELVADEAVPYQSIVDVLDAGRSAGDDDVGLIIKQD